VFDSIRGTLTRREPARVVVETGGIGYEVQVSLSTFEALPPTGSEARLLLHAVVREDEWRLFGFATGSERQAFRAVLRVGGVGPVTALSLLSGLTPTELARAIAARDVKALMRVKGIGRKTAERIVLELKDVLGDEAGEGGGVSPAPGGPHEDAVRALAALGLDPAEARRRVEALSARLGDVGVAELVRAALRG
jgi:Holliday junction DNA helicase RuvA